MLRMEQLDSNHEPVSILPLWSALAGRLAVAVGAGTALTSLFFDVPLSRACVRGGLAWLLVRTLAKGVSWLLERTTAEPQNSESDQPEEESEASATNAKAA